MTPLEAALAYAEMGWFVVPGHPQQKRPLTPGEDWSASRDPDVIRDWWVTWPDAMVGVVLGPSGLLAVDVDMHDTDEDGHESIRRLSNMLGHDADWLKQISVASLSGGGGHHYLFKTPTSVSFSKRKVKWMPGVDIMVGTTYLVLPPSTHPNGLQYEWFRSPFEHELTDLPPELLEHLAKSASDEARRPGSTVDMAGLLANGSRSGSRNQDLIRLIGYLRRQHGDTPEGLAETRRLIETWRDRCQPPYRGGEQDDEFERTWASGISLDHTDRNPNWPGTAALAEEGLGRLTGYGLARWFEPRIGSRVRYHTGTSRMLVWDSRRWAENDANDYPLWPSLKTWGVLHQLEAEVLLQANQVPESQAKQLRLFLDRALDRRYTSEAVLGVAQSPGRAVNRDDLDAHPNLLHCSNGVVDLTTGQLRAHDPALLNASLVPYDYTPDAPTGALRAQLETMFPGDPEMQRYLQRAVGCSLFGDNRAKVMFVLRGPANTGKSTLLQTVLPVLGAGTDGAYADVADKKLFVAPKNEQHPAGLADALGYRLILMSEEYGPQDKLNMPVLKAITGADRLKARQMRENFWSGVPRCTPWMATNHELRLGEFDEAVRTRLRIIDVPGVITKERRRDNVTGELLAEAEGLLAWAVAGAVEYSRIGLADPQRVLDAVSEAVDAQDRVKTFAEEELTTWEGTVYTPEAVDTYGATEEDLWDCYQRWCVAQGAPPLYRSEFDKRIFPAIGLKRVKPKPGVSGVHYPVSVGRLPGS